MKNILTTILLFSFYISIGQNIIHREYKAKNGVKYKTGSTVTYNGIGYKIKKIYQNKKTNEFYFKLKDKSIEDINVNESIKECSVTPCEIVSNVDFKKCNLKRNEIDRFTKKSIKETRKRTIYSDFGSGIRVYGFSVNNKNSLIFEVSRTGIFSISKGDVLYLMLETGDVMELYYSNNKIAKIQSSEYNLWKLEAFFDLTEKQISILKSNLVKEFRFMTDEGYFEDKIYYKAQNNIASVLNCILPE